MKIHCLFLVAFVVCACAFGDNLVQTPHGYRPSKCVHRHSENAFIEELADGSGTRVTYEKSGKEFFFETDPDCVADALDLGNARRNGKAAAGLQTWQDYASYDCPKSMANFTSVYQIPDESPAGGRQLLYYFIGWENKHAGGLTIVQPVVNYDLSGQYPTGWSMEPWNCCPAGQTHSGKNVKMGPTQSAKAWVYTMNGNVVIGQSKMDNSSPTTLTVKMNNRVWDWACATLEDYSATCAQTNAKPFICSDMVLTATDGSNVVPSWQTTGQTACKGGVTVQSPAEVSIYGQNKP